MRHFVLFGPGYVGSRLGAVLERSGWRVSRVGRDADPEQVETSLRSADALLSTVPPDAAGDPVLLRWGAPIARVPWLGYLSSTGVYGDTGGAWVDEGAPIAGRRTARNDADRAWLDRGGRVFRLPGIYGPGRSVLDRLSAGMAHRVDLPSQVFSRIHVDDVVAAVCAALDRGPPTAYNIADDLPAAQNRLIEWACQRLDLPLPTVKAVDDPALSPATRAFYRENRRVANGKAKRLLGWRPVYPTWREGLGALAAAISPSSG
jgi:nucleoside-diphosphate-sugar epimerase